MPKRKLSDLFLYRHRVALGYVFVFGSLAVALTLALVIPFGLTSAEMKSAVVSHAGSLLAVNSPYHLLQNQSIRLFGLTVVGIKLPSLVMGGLLGVSVFLLLRRWLSLAMAVFGSVMIFTGTAFLTLAGTGSPLIMSAVFPALLLFLGTRVLTHDRGVIIFSILLLITTSLALLTPGMVYLVLLALTLGIVNPHVRYGFKRLPTVGLGLLGLGFVASFTPMVLLIISDFANLHRLLALPVSISPLTLKDNFGLMFSLLARFLHPGIDAGWLVPLVGLGTSGLAILGLYRTVHSIYTTRSQFIIGIGLIGGILALLSANSAVLIYLPLVLLAAIGLSQLAAIWYRTFPLNPYARVTALLPIGVLIVGIVLGSTIRYVNTSLYAAGSREAYSHDLEILHAYLARNAPAGVTLAVRPGDVTFYKLLGAGTTVVGESAGAREGAVISSEQINGRVPVRILTDDRAEDADRFYVYR